MGLQASSQVSPQALPEAGVPADGVSAQPVLDELWTLYEFAWDAVEQFPSLQSLGNCGPGWLGEVVSCELTAAEEVLQRLAQQVARAQKAIAAARRRGAPAVVEGFNS